MKVTLIGFGNLGQGFVKSLQEKAADFKDRYDLSIQIVAVADINGAVIDEEGLSLEKLLSVAESGELTDFSEKSEEGKSAVEVIKEVDSDLVLELTPTDIETGEPGLTHIKEAMKAGRNVVTSNKGPLVVAFQDLEDLARKMGVEFRYSASVGGAIPVIGLARNQLAGDEVNSIRGVLNGTTNYILTRMEKEGAPFDVVLREAQELGIAEKDPTLDIEGIDTAAKLVILANALLDRGVTLDDVDITGVTRMNPRITQLAKETGNTIRLIGYADSDTLEVSPRLVPVGHPLAVRGSLNAVMLETDLAREISITGFGAGSHETSSALLGDLVDVYRSIED
ncbi:MAG: homoserine dehydrogenase [Hadesarchaea archaeon]|nr:homoserine dehydrogenase [Hadesarchaea archaeon]